MSFRYETKPLLNTGKQSIARAMQGFSVLSVCMFKSKIGYGHLCITSCHTDPTLWSVLALIYHLVLR